MEFQKLQANKAQQVKQMVYLAKKVLVTKMKWNEWEKRRIFSGWSVAKQQANMTQQSTAMVYLANKNGKEGGSLYFALKNEEEAKEEYLEAGVL